MIRFVRVLVTLLVWAFPFLTADYRRRVKPRCKCLACGAVKRHRLQFDPAQKLVVITCVVCSCSWGCPALVKPEKIVAPPREEDAE